MGSSRTRQRSGATSHAHQPHTTTGMGQDKLWQRPTATQTSLEQGEGIWKAEDEDGERPTHPHVLSLLSLCVCIRSFAVFFPLLAFSTNATSERKPARLAQTLRSPLPSPSWRGAIWSPATPGIPVLCRSRNDTAPVRGEREGRVKIPNCFSKLPRLKAKQVSAALRKSC